jgi:hypothetical protein
MGTDVMRIGERGALALRILRSATAACAERDAARAHVVLLFEQDAREQGIGARGQGLVERLVDLALRVADLARLTARPGAPEVAELAVLCARCDTVVELGHHAVSGDAEDGRLEVALHAAEISAARAERRWRSQEVPCLAC